MCSRQSPLPVTRWVVFFHDSVLPVHFFCSFVLHTKRMITQKCFVRMTQTPVKQGTKNVWMYGCFEVCQNFVRLIALGCQLFGGGWDNCILWGCRWSILIFAFNVASGWPEAADGVWFYWWTRTCQRHHEGAHKIFPTKRGNGASRNLLTTHSHDSLFQWPMWLVSCTAISGTFLGFEPPLNVVNLVINLFAMHIYVEVCVCKKHWQHNNMAVEYSFVCIVVAFLYTHWEGWWFWRWSEDVSCCPSHDTIAVEIFPHMSTAYLFALQSTCEALWSLEASTTWLCKENFQGWT